MSLLDNGPHTVKVFLEETVTDSYGNEIKRPSATGVIVRGCWVQPTSAARGSVSAVDVSAGQRVTATWRLIARNPPVGWWSRVEWPAWGKRFIVLGGPLHRDYSRATSHVSVSLQEER